MSVKSRPRAILFDLDGTLLDTAPDLAAALNRVRAQQALPPLAFERIRPWVSHGSFALTRLGFAVAEDSAEFEALRQALLAEYHAHVADRSCLFDGMAEILLDLTRRDLRSGIVTNKPGWLTAPLLAKLGLDLQFSCVISGDTLTTRKPDPAPLLHAAQMLGVATRDCVYIGDAERDVEAGRRAGMVTLVALYGYLGDSDTPEQWGADGYLAAPSDLASWLDQS
ncbi:MAG: phosphoglycolate phosphatase [Gammaproteobacteria bacterium]|nr:phosphoglycolate phosphatase [Gammaproteobacteria bacterium]